MSIQDFLNEVGGERILVIGDLMLDRYTWGNAERVSPEAPVLVLRADEQEMRLGGAASVAALLRHLDAEVTLAGVIGDDTSGRLLMKLLDEEQINRDLVFSVAGRPTTSKERFVGRAVNRHPHQILRVDCETREEVADELANSLRDEIVRQLAGHGVVIISDYAKGVCTAGLLNAVIDAARNYRIPVVVDPPRINDYGRYRGASLLTPNRREAEFATGHAIGSPTDALTAGRLLADRDGSRAVFVTLDRDGIAIVGEARGESIERVEPAQSREVYDITGAGDIVVAIAGICLGHDLPLEETARLANIAAGWEIEQIGVAPVTWDQVRTTLESEFAPVVANTHPSSDDNLCQKIVALRELTSLAASHVTQNRKIVFTNGCFDLLHVGHVSYLQEAAELGDVLIVAINSDRGVRALKGPSRPIVGERDRARMLAALSCVDHVVIFDEDTPHRLLDLLRPDVLVKGGSTNEVVGREIVEAYGGRVRLTSCTDDVSTSNIVASIRQQRDRTDEKRDIVLSAES